MCLKKRPHPLSSIKLEDNTLMSIISEIQQKADFQATIKPFIALFMDFNRPWQAGDGVSALRWSASREPTEPAGETGHTCVRGLASLTKKALRFNLRAFR